MEAKVLRFNFQQGKKIFTLSKASRLALGPTQDSWKMATGDSSSGHEADQSPPSSVQVKYGGSIPPFPNMSS
jgi:hypothetical protein